MTPLAVRTVGAQVATGTARRDSSPTSGPTGRARPTVAVIGAGASGTLTAMHLLGGDAVVWLIDPAADTGRGVAYSTSDPRHRLNVCAGQMSALPGDPDHFLRWAAGRNSEVRPADYLPRALYGEYLAATLTTSAAGRPAGALQRLHAAAQAVNRVAGRFRVTLGNQRHLMVDAVVLAIGNAAPSVDWAPPALLASGRLIADPWLPAALTPLRDGAPVLLVGSGLTMVDIALSAAALSDTGVLVAVSRSGLLPRIHEPSPASRPCPPVLPAGPLRLTQVVAALQAQAAELGSWPAAVDSLRPLTSQVWRRLSAGDQAEFLRCYARSWDVLRHRMAPEVGVEFQRLRAHGRLTLRKGSVEDAQAAPGRVVVRVAGLWHGFGHVVNCTGPRTDLATLGDPLLDQLFAAGLARADPLRLGLDTHPSGALRDGTGEPTAGLWAVGPARRGALWESTAVPEIRCQAATVAAELLADVRAH